MPVPVRSPGRVPLLVVLLVALGVFVAACEIEIQRGTPTEPADDAEFEDIDEEGAVPLIIVEGPEGSTLAYVPVTINGEGPFQFALDTGASNSVIDAQLAEDLGLEQVGDARPGVGVGGVAEAVPVGVSAWAIDDVDLGEGTLLAIELGEADRDVGLEGLLGSDVLSAFGSITVDYDEEVLHLGTRAEAAAVE